MATASAFSYAQAAKGQNPTPESPQSTSHVTDPLATVPASATTPLDDASVADSGNQDNIAASAEKHEAASTIGSESDVRSESVLSRRTDARKDDELSRLERPWRRNDRDGQSSTRSDDTDGKRRKAKKKGADKPAEEEQPKVELTEAPVPSVNIWQQRREAAAAKVVKPDDASSTAASEDVKPPPKVTDFAGAVNGHKTTRKADAPRPERASRGARVADREARDGRGELPPPVDDAMLWPTPETAVQEDKDSKKKNDAKPEPKETQEETGKPRSKEKWVTYDYVPTVNFETQLPQMRNTKPRGGARNVNGGRPSAPSQTADKAASAAPATKTNDRRQSTANGVARTGSQPPSKRASVDVATLREQRKVSGGATSEKAKDATPAAPSVVRRARHFNAISPTNASQQEQPQAPRERPEGRAEGRADRGRGGYRGRGGHHTNSHSQAQHATFNGNGPASGRPQGPYSPPPRGGHGQMFMPPSQRGRGGRGNAANFHHRMSLPNGRLPAVQTQFASYEFPVGPMSAIPFQPQQPYWDTAIPVLKTQIEYYFSIENLCKDLYLRQRMDSQGFVPLHFIAAFKRVRELSADLGMLRTVCEMSTEIDLVVGEDDVERVRRSEGWESFVLPLEDRDDLARNHGPVKLSFKSRGPYPAPPQFNGMQMHYGMPSPPAFVPHDQFQQFDHHAMNGVNGVNGHGQKGSQLSAAVPDFAPACHAPALKANGAVNGTYEMQNGIHTQAEA
ncbi:La domain family [Cordyceps fumosorosea ARSEF 2679]|uniref:La domain family n=1 Tax=Cordyceps fumosorosea (strain ARSEF 2679) TaxID=1081104 RepID=A0A167WMV1_CORFA|nr:La domain family [Cordyceps fumosorosea ARSEF 2679]OAA63988.1 La domain family [Cordyceps fumosorosea ARSEF 2679]